MKTKELNSTIKSLNILTKLITKAFGSIFLLCFAKWVQRFGRFLDKTEPGPMFVVLIGCMIGLSFGFFNQDMRHVELNIPLWKCVWTGCIISFKFGFTALAILYGMWETLQVFKWLYKWSERYQKYEFKNGIEKMS